MNDIEADSYQWDTPRDSKAPDLKPYAELVKALAEKDREIVKWSELIGSFTRSQHRYLVEMERLKQALAEKDLELELADFTIKESLEKIAAMDKEIQQIREHEYQRGYQDGQAASTGSHTRT